MVTYFHRCFIFEERKIRNCITYNLIEHFGSCNIPAIRRNIKSNIEFKRYWIQLRVACAINSGHEFIFARKTRANL